jgi:hypothetical protein
MSLQPDDKFKAQFMVAQARAAKAYYSLLSLTPSMDEKGQWELRFFVAGKPDDVNAASPLSNSALHGLLNRHFSNDGQDRPLFESDRNSNMHVARVSSKERAEELAHELMELFEAKGISPMVDALQLYKPPGVQKAQPLSFNPLLNRRGREDGALRPLIRRNNWHFKP